MIALPIGLILAAVVLHVRSTSTWDVVSGTRIVGDDTDSNVHIVQLQSARGRICVFTVGEHWRVGYSPLEERYWNRGWVLDRWHGDLEGPLSRPKSRISINVSAPITRHLEWHGFEYRADYRKAGPNERWVRQILFPHWALACVGAIIPLPWLVRRARRNARIHRGLCGECGYDLRASHERCPECGTPFSAELSHAGTTVDKA